MSTAVPSPGVLSPVWRDAELLLARASAAEEMLQPGHALRPRTYTVIPIADLPAPIGEGDAWAWLDGNLDELAETVHTCLVSHWYVTGWQLADAAGPVLHTRRRYDTARMIHRWGLAAAEACGDTEATAQMLTSGGLLELDPGHATLALARFPRAEELYFVIGDRVGAARVLHYQGLAYRALGNTTEPAPVMELPPDTRIRP